MRKHFSGQRKTLPEIFPTWDLMGSTGSMNGHRGFNRIKSARKMQLPYAPARRGRRNSHGDCFPGPREFSVDVESSLW